MGSNVRLIPREPRLPAIPQTEEQVVGYLQLLNDALRRELSQVRGSIAIFGEGRPIIKTFVDLDTTPPVGVPDPTIEYLFICTNSGATNLTTFDGGVDAQPIAVFFTDANTTLIDGATLQLSGSVNYNPPANTLMSFKRDTSAWQERSRSNN